MHDRCDEALQRTAGIGPHHDEYNGEMPGNGMGAARRKGTTIQMKKSNKYPYIKKQQRTK
jgi:hypothetical protein